MNKHNLNKIKKKQKKKKMLEEIVDGSISYVKNKHKKKKKKMLEETESEEIVDSSVIPDTNKRITTPEKLSSGSISYVKNKHKKKKKKILEETESEEIDGSVIPDTNQRITTPEKLSSGSISYVKNKHKKKKRKILELEESEQTEECIVESDASQMSSCSFSVNENKEKNKKKKTLVIQIRSEQNGESLVHSDIHLSRNTSQSSISEHTPVLKSDQEASDEATVVKTEHQSGIIPQKVPSEISTIIHGSNKIKVTQDRSSEFLLHNYGIRLRTGTWTAVENKILRKNYKHAMKKIPEDDQQYILYISHDSPPQLQSRIRKVIAETRFYSKLGRHLNRLPISCLKRAKHVFQDLKVTGKFSDAEKEELNRLVLIHGHKWKKISKIMGRSEYSIASYFHKYRPKGGKGLFTPLENQQLENAVKDVKKEYGLPDDQLKNLPWAEIANRVPTRSVIQCRIHWLRRLQRSESGDTEAVFSKLANKKLLIELINNSEIEHEFDINWADIAKQISSKLTSQYLQIYWNRMKKTMVPDYSVKSFDEILEFLYNKFHS